MRTAKKALAASFVMTFAAGCDNKGSAPPAAPTVDVSAGSVGSAAASAAAPATASAAGSAAAPGTATATATAAGTAAATGTTTATGTATGSASVTHTLPPAPTTGHVTRQADGTCMWFADVMCPRGPNGRLMPCNPPRPHEVECPPDAGKSP